MSSAGYPFQLVGFSKELDRKKLFFVEPLHAADVCSACRLVPSIKVSLPCEHIFCEACYEQCERGGRVDCPMDGDITSAEEVQWINDLAGSMLEKQVLCWNYTNGCNEVMAAAELSKHFHEECRHHSANCFICDTNVLATEFCAHVKSHYDNSTLPSGDEDQPRKTVVEKNCVPGEDGVTNNLLNVTEADQDRLVQNASKIAWAKSSPNENTPNVVTLLLSIMPVVTTHTWTFDGYSPLNQEAKEHGRAVATFDPVYLRGYYVSLGIRIRRGNICILFELHKGKLDQFLEWPFNLKINFSLLQPQGPDEQGYSIAPGTLTLHREKFLRPVKQSNHWVQLWEKYACSANLESQGFIKDGTMKLSLALDPIESTAP